MAFPLNHLDLRHLFSCYAFSAGEALNEVDMPTY
jgi:hypothetical protein